MIKNEISGFVLSSNAPIDNFVGNIVYAEEKMVAIESSKSPMITLVVEADGFRKVLASVNGEFNIAAREMGPALEKEQLDEEITRKIKILQSDNVNKLIESKNLFDYITIKDTIQNVSIKDSTISGIVNGEIFETSVSNLYKKDEQLYIKEGQDTFQIVNLNSDYVETNKIKNINQFFDKTNEFTNDLKKITINNYDIQKESMYNNVTKKFEESYILVYGSKEIILDNNTVLSLDNGFIQKENDIKFLKNPKNIKLQSNIEQSSKTCTVENNNQIKIDNNILLADIINTEHKIAIEKGVIYTIQGNGPTPIGIDLAKPEKIDVNYVSKEINDLTTDKLKNLKLNIYPSEKIDNWNIERYGTQMILTGTTKDGPINHQLISIKEESLGNIRNGLNIESASIPRAYIRVDGQKTAYDLGFPSELMTNHSAYSESISNKIEQYGFQTIAIDTNTKMQDKLKYTEPEEAVRGIPKECFVVLDDKLFLKINNTLINNECSLDFKNEQFNVQSAFTAIPSDTREIKALMNQSIHVTKEDGEYNLTVMDKLDDSKQLSIIPTSEYSNDKFGAKEEDLVRNIHNEEMIMD